VICTKTAFKDLAAIRRHLTRARLDHKPRKTGCLGEIWCEQCGAYHLIYAPKGKKKAVA